MSSSSPQLTARSHRHISQPGSTLLRQTRVRRRGDLLEPGNAVIGHARILRCCHRSGRCHPSAPGPPKIRTRCDRPQTPAPHSHGRNPTTGPRPQPRHPMRPAARPQRPATRRMPVPVDARNSREGHEQLHPKVPRRAGIGHHARRDLECALQRGRAVPVFAVGLLGGPVLDEPQHDSCPFAVSTVTVRAEMRDDRLRYPPVLIARRDGPSPGRLCPQGVAHQTPGAKVACVEKL